MKVTAEPEETLSESGWPFQSVAGFLTVLDREGRVLAASDTFWSTFRAEPGDFCHRICRHRRDPCEDCPVQRTFEEGKGVIQREELLLPDGSTLPVQVQTSPLKGPAGGVQTVVALLADLSPRMGLEEKWRESQERYRAIFEEVPCYISVQDRNLKILETNRAFRETFGGSVGAHCFETYKHRAEPCLDCPVARTFSDGQVHHSEELVVSQTGRPIHTLVSTAPIRNGKGEIEAVMEMSADVTQIRNLEDRLSKAGLLAGMLLHGLKGHLMGLDGGAYLISTGLEKGMKGRVQEGWAMVQRNVEKIRSVVRDFLFLAKEREPIFQCVRLEEVAHGAARAVGRAAERTGVALRVRLEDVGRGKVDARALEESLVNLLENAIHACQQDASKKEHHVTLSLFRQDGKAVFAVEDNGVGMDRETQDRLFRLFFSTKGSAGTGLGLFVAQEVARMHRGTLTVDSKLGRGSRFQLELPLDG
jgi:PAS domain S-box-containing protein